MKIPATLIFLLIPVLYGHSQDTIIAENYFAHEIVNGKLTGKKLISYQHTYNLDSVLILKTEYDSTSPSIIALTYYYYNKGMLISEEKHSIENGLEQITRYTYSGNKLSNIRFYEMKNGKPDLKYSENYLYQGGILSGRETIDPNGKWLSKTLIANSDNKITETTKYKNGAHPQKIKNIQIVSDLQNGHIIHKHIHTTNFNGSEINIYHEYQIDSITGRILYDNMYNNNKELLSSTQYLWRKDGSPKFILTKDSEGLYLKYIRSKKFVHQLKFELKEMYNFGHSKPN